MFNLKQTEKNSLSVFDEKGVLISQIDPGKLNAGNHEIILNTSGFENGVYFLHLSDPLKINMVQRILVLR